jgi:hypothetical protein
MQHPVQGQGHLWGLANVWKVLERGEENKGRREGGTKEGLFLAVMSLYWGIIYKPQNGMCSYVIFSKFLFTK